MLMLVSKRNFKNCVSVCLLLDGPGHAKTCLMTYANNKDADQPAV